MDPFQQRSNPISGAVLYKGPKQTGCTDPTLKRTFPIDSRKIPTKESQAKLLNVPTQQRTLSSSRASFLTV